MPQSNLLIVSSDDIGWAEVRSLLNAMPDVCVIGEATGAQQALRLAANQRPGVVITPSRLEGAFVLPLLAEIRGCTAPECKLVVLSWHVEVAEFAALAEFGVSAHLLWDGLSTAILGRVLATVIADDVVVTSRAVAEAFVTTRGPTLEREGTSASGAIQVDTSTGGKPVPFVIFLATDRPAVQAFFLNLERTTTDRIQVIYQALAGDVITAAPMHLEAAEVAVVDVASEFPAAITLCNELPGRRPDLPVVGLVCCPTAITPWQLQTLGATGVRGLLDLRLPSREVMYILRHVAKGEVALHVRLGSDHAQWANSLISEQRQSRAGPRPLLDADLSHLLVLVTQGLTDAEIGQHINLSPHTVKHRIEHLRRAVGMGSRVELAAWAGRHGFYHPESAPGE